MGDTEDDARYPTSSYGSHPHGYDSAQPPKLSGRSGSYSRQASHYDEDEEEDDEDLGEEEDHNGQNGYPSVQKNVGDDDEDDDDDELADDDEDDKGKLFKRVDDDDDDDDDDDMQKHPKKRKLKSLISSYEFAPRVPAPALPTPRQSHGGRNALTDWTEHETFVLLDAWGDRFLRHGKKSLRSDEWQEVADRVSEVSKIERTDTQCRNRLDTLKKKYKKERLKFAETGSGTSKWVYFKKMDMLMSSPQQQAGLSCGLDSGEFVFMNPRVYLNRANGLDEMRDSPGNSESAEGVEDESDGLPPKKRRFGRDNDERSSFRLLADSIQKFSDIYEKIERKRRQQMVELEKMRMDFHRDLETEKRQIMERAHAEIAKMWQAEEEENDVSAENASKTSLEFPTGMKLCVASLSTF